MERNYRDGGMISHGEAKVETLQVSKPELSNT